MSFSTTADEKKDQLFENLRKIAKELRDCSKLSGEVISLNTWGSDDWSSEFKKVMEKAEIDFILMARQIEIIFNRR